MSMPAHAIEARPPRLRLRLAPEPASDGVVLMARFVAPDGREWSAIGGGATVGAAIEFARESCPVDASWRPVGWDHLHGT
jgi:hypothetical protein